MITPPATNCTTRNTPSNRDNLFSARYQGATLTVAGPWRRMKVQRLFFYSIFLSLPGVLFYNLSKFLQKSVKTDDRKIQKRNDLRLILLGEIGNQSHVLESRYAQPATDTLSAPTPEDVSAMENINEINNLLEPVIHRQFNCTRLFLGDQEEQEKVKSFHSKYPYKHVQEASFVKAASRCQAYIQARGYATHVPEEEAEFPLAYSITIHKHADQFERLLRVIYRPNNYYCIHVDKKSSKKLHAAIKAIADCFDNVFVASKLEVVVYGGFTRLQADLNCMEDLFHRYTDWKYLLNLAGTELPLKSNKELVYLLKLYKGRNIVGKNHKVLPSRWKQRYLTRVVNMTGSIKVVNKTNTKPPFNLTMIKGSAYAIFSRDMIGYILHDPLPIKFLKWCSHTYSPDEHYWATLNDLDGNPHLKTPGANNSPDNMFITRAVLWNSRACAGKNVHKVCQYGVKNLPWLKEKPEFVANKFDLETDFAAFDCMEELLAQRSRNSEPWDLQIHQQFIRNHLLRPPKS